MKCVYYGTGEVRKGAQVQCGHVYIVKKKKGRLPAFYTLCPFSLFVLLALLFICVQKFQTMLLFNCGYVKHPFPLSNACGGKKNYLSCRT